jgi:hypothetical protein
MTPKSKFLSKFQIIKRLFIFSKVCNLSNT